MEPKETTSLTMTVEEAAHYIGIGRTSVYKLVDSGELPCIRFGKAIRIPKAAIEKWVKDKSEYTPRG